MLIIRDDQLNAMSDFCRRVFEDTLVGCLREEFPEEAASMDDEELRGFVVAQIGKAASYGITDEQDVEHYLCRSLCYGESWDTSLDWAKDILNDPIWTGADKILQIYQHEHPDEELAPRVPGRRKPRLPLRRRRRRPPRRRRRRLLRRRRSRHPSSPRSRSSPCRRRSRSATRSCLAGRASSTTARSSG
jgi:hypothetical protein